MKVAVVGTGYVGLVTGVCLAEVGHTVSCVDTNEDKVSSLKRAISPIYEPGIEELLSRNMEHHRLFFTTKLAEAVDGCEMVFIAVGTPQGHDGKADLSYVEQVARQLGQLIDPSTIVVVKSTVPVGTCDRVEAILDEEFKKRTMSDKPLVTSCPEFLKEGTAIDDFMKPDRIIVGVNDWQTEPAFQELFRPFLTVDPGKLLMMDRYSSELSKYGANTMLATRIIFMNELARLCDKVGANIDSVRIAMGSDPRIGNKFLFAGPGYGGSCFPKDVIALCHTGLEHGVELEVLHAVAKANEKQKHYVANKVISHFGGLKDKKLAIWGLSFKPGTDDVRDTPAFVIVRKLMEAGAQLVCHDPKGAANFKNEFGEYQNVTYVEQAYDALEGADGMVLITEWSEYKTPNWQKVKELMRSHAIFDFRNQYQGDQLTELGFQYTCIGRPLKSELA